MKFGVKGKPLPASVRKKISESLKKALPGGEEIGDTGGSFRKIKEETKRAQARFKQRITGLRAQFDSKIKEIREFKKTLGRKKATKAQRDELAKKIKDCISCFTRDINSG